MKAGDTVRVNGVGTSETAEVLSVNGDDVTVRTAAGRRKVVKAARVFPERVTAGLPDAQPPDARGASVHFAPDFKPLPKPEPPLRSRPYLDWVRAKPCSSCTADGPSDPHHYGHRGIGQKASDLLVVPLCRRCHDHFHDHRMLPGTSLIQTRVFLLATQVSLLSDWITAEKRA